ENRVPVEKTRWQILVVVEKSLSGAPVHMNGRVYDFELARFISADPYVQDATDTQAYNRYSYVSNNPLTHIDPSGFISLKDVLKIVVVVVLVAVTAGAVAWALAPSSAGIGGVWGGLGAIASGSAGAGAIVAAGAASGFVGSFAGTLLNGGSLGDAFQAGVEGAVTGAVSSALAFGIGHGIGKDWHNIVKAFAHGAAQGTITEAQGGEFRHGFYAAFATKMTGGAIMKAGNEAGVIGRTVAAAIIGGGASALGGGKFANGAISGAFTHLFNDEYGRKVGRQILIEESLANEPTEFEGLGYRRKGLGENGEFIYDEVPLLETEYVSFGEAVTEYAEANGVSVSYFSGKIGLEARLRIFSRFNDSPDSSILVLTHGDPMTGEGYPVGARVLVGGDDIKGVVKNGWMSRSKMRNLVSSYVPRNRCESCRNGQILNAGQIVREFVGK
ncbi:hypothetical protein MLD52_22595, partial [Puniceicoccaceae bacterium K14]|nr:hypothetical protein [Puniceicoccaceae bacterium K14]